MQAIDRTAPVLPLMPGTPARMTHDYVRHGTTSLFAAFDLASGSVIAQHYRRHCHQESWTMVWDASHMSNLPAASAEDVADQPARTQFEAFLDEHRSALNRCLDGLTEEQVHRSLVPSRTTLLGLVKHATFVEKVWFDEAITCRSRAEIGIPMTPDESFILNDDDTIATVQRAHSAACEASRHATSSLALDGPRQPTRPAPAALGVPPRPARTRSALRTRRHPARAAHRGVARRVRSYRRQRVLPTVDAIAKVGGVRRR
jgi:hypothetical protein